MQIGDRIQAKPGWNIDNEPNLLYNSEFFTLGGETGEIVVLGGLCQVKFDDGTIRWIGREALTVIEPAPPVEPALEATPTPALKTLKVHSITLGDLTISGPNISMEVEE